MIFRIGETLKRMLRRAGVPMITDAQLRALIIERRGRVRQKAETARKANDVIGDYLFTLNDDAMTRWVKEQGEKQ